MSLKDRYINFKKWQKQPFSVAPLDDQAHICATCDTKFKGNFCPRCGQSAKVEPRMSLWKTILLILDVWGLGNRGMFRTLRDLILRPGYLICDYLNGKRSAYFPPFKLLFLLTALSLFMGHGFNLIHENYQSVPEIFSTEQNPDNDAKSQIEVGFITWVSSIISFQQEYPALFQLCFICFAGYFFYIFFKNSKILGKIEFNEFFIGLVYMVDMYILYSVFFRFFGYFGMERAVKVFLPFLYLIPLKQLSGFGWWNTIFRSLAGLSIGVIFLGVILIGMILLSFLIFK